MAHDVFISHSNTDKTVANAMCSRLEKEGIRCWIAPRDVRPGRNWGSEIIRGLDNAKVMIVVLSANANRSRSVMKEVERAFDKKIVIIPVRTEEVEPSEALEFFLSSEHWLDAITPPVEAHIDRLASTVKEYLVEQGWKVTEGAVSEENADEIPFLKTTKGRWILWACAGLAVAMVALVAMLGESQRNKRQPYPSPTATPDAASAQAVPAKFLDPKLPGGVPGPTKEKPFVNSLGMKFVPVPGADVLFSVWETRVKDYQAFCDATGRTWKKPRFEQAADHPAVDVSWADATEFCEWLSSKDGKRYRLPTDHEWSCAVGIGDREDASATPKSKGKIDNVFPWGKQWPPPNDAGNYFGEECKTPAGLAALKAAGYDPSNGSFIEGFNDGNVFTAAVGSFRPNGLGIYDLGGNVWEWCQDEYEPGSALRVLRGGSWGDRNRDVLLSSFRNRVVPDFRSVDLGFRVVVEAGSGR